MGLPQDGLQQDRLAQDGLPGARRFWAVLSLLLALGTSSLLGSVINLALPSIAQELQASPGDAVWVVNAYMLALVICLLPFASLGEILGLKRVFLAGMVGMVATSVICALAPSLPLLVAGRGLQGVASAAVISVSTAQIRAVFPASQLGRAVGMNAMTVALAGTLGPGVGGLVLSLADWPWLFAMNLPLMVLSLVVGRLALPRSPRSGRRFDRIGAGLNVVAFALAFIGLDQLVTRPPLGAALLVASGLAMVVLVRQQRGQAVPLLPLDLLARPAMSRALVASSFGFVAQSMGQVCLPFLLHERWALSPAQSGWLMLCWPAASGLMAPVVGRLADRMPTAVLCAMGMLLLTAGQLLLSLVPPAAGVVVLAACIIACGAGFGVFQTPNIRSILTAAPVARSGGAGGLQATARQTGWALGTTGAAAVFRLMPEDAAANGLRVAACSAALAALLSVLRHVAGRRGG
jgi:DHA2 family multidrug resistance protein-like MFS transporter